jgi:hypothetical protein
MKASISVELASGETDEVRGLINELDQTLAANYRPDERHGVPLSALFRRLSARESFLKSCSVSRIFNELINRCVPFLSGCFQGLVG